jgi:hypothetical protein
MEDKEKRDRAWVQAALAGELKKLEDLEEGENINKPDSAFFACLLKIAAIAKGTGQTFTYFEEVLSLIKIACSDHAWLKAKEIERQFTNAWRLAEPRFRPE